MKGLELVIENAIEINSLERASVSCMMIQKVNSITYTIMLTDDYGRAATLFDVSSYKNARQSRSDVREVIDNMKPPKVTGGVHNVGEKGVSEAIAKVREMIGDLNIDAQFTYNLPERFEYRTFECYDEPKFVDSGMPATISMSIRFGSGCEMLTLLEREYNDVPGIYDAMVRDASAFIYMNKVISQ